VISVIIIIIIIIIIFVYLIDDKLQGRTQQKLYTEGLSTAKLLPQTAHSG